MLAAVERGTRERAACDPAFDHYVALARRACRVARGNLPWEDFASRDSWVVTLALYRVAAGWALAALLERDPRAIESGLRAEPDEALATALSRVEGSAVIPELFADPNPSEPLESLRRRCHLARGAVEQLVALGVRRRVLPERLLAAYAARRSIAGALVAVLLLVGIGLAALPGHPFSTNIATGRRWTASSALERHGEKTGVIGGPPGKYFFHTEEQSSPWLVIDLGAGATVSGVTIRNRTDCCGARAVPLLVEVSPDGEHYTEVARQKRLFDSWSVDFARTPARFLRLRVPRTTTLHLKALEVFR